VADDLNPQDVASSIEALLDDIGRHSDPAVHAAAGELVRLMMKLYGAGLQQIVTIVELAAGKTLVQRMASDPAVSALLALHGLHPIDMPTRVRYAVDSAKRKLGSHGEDVSLEGVHPDTGIVHVRISGGGCGVATLRDVVENAILDAAPEVANIEFEEASAGPPVLQIGMRPPAPANS